ncbi:hypothetical protein G436_4581 [Leptospira interrogans serovar Hardjo str. Norma]|uniref:Uncharacterized protein n=1 Tax=Leptospira interrogans serovar Hardjo str. Norma TaxID=1279460 RepID=A0A0M5L9H4_LEPIR|nr:hypothetical protein G436_4581 [Leptospira interrogans serovar Hardjo str. Norma]
MKNSIAAINKTASIDCFYEMKTMENSFFNNLKESINEIVSVAFQIKD